MNIKEIFEDNKKITFFMKAVDAVISDRSPTEVEVEMVLKFLISVNRYNSKSLEYEYPDGFMSFEELNLSEHRMELLFISYSQALILTSFIILATWLKLMHSKSMFAPIKKLVEFIDFDTFELFDMSMDLGTETQDLEYWINVIYVGKREGTSVLKSKKLEN